MYYAQIDSNNIVRSVTQTSSVVNQSDMIQIDSLDMSLLGKLYQGGTFVDVPEV